VRIKMNVVNEVEGVALEQAMHHDRERESCGFRKMASSVSFIRVEGRAVVLKRRAASIVIQLCSAYCSEVSSIPKSAAMDTTY
jgi:hypothetical protein